MKHENDTFAVVLLEKSSSDFAFFQRSKPHQNRFFGAGLVKNPQKQNQRTQKTEK